jgi:hypothetical protein
MVKRYFPAGTTAFCQCTSWPNVKVPAASWAEARLGAKLKAVRVRAAAYTNLRMEVMESPVLDLKT